MVARNGALNAEKAMEALRGAEDKEKEIEVLVDMRDRFNVLEDKILKNEEPLSLLMLQKVFINISTNKKGRGTRNACDFRQSKRH